MNEITSDLLKSLAPQTPKAKRDRFLESFNQVLPKYGITTKKRVASFLATVIMESDYLKATAEYASGMDYDITKNRRKALQLGNTSNGDGPKYKGRSLIQTTGKNNYKRVSDILGVNFVDNPKKLEEPRWAVEAACVYWKDNNLNKYSDKGQFFEVQGLVNRGSITKQAKDYAKRESIYNKALALIPEDFKLSSPTVKKTADSQPIIAEDIIEDVAPDIEDVANNADNVNLNINTPLPPADIDKPVEVVKEEPKESTGWGTWASNIRTQIASLGIGIPALTSMAFLTDPKFLMIAGGVVTAAIIVSLTVWLTTMYLKSKEKRERERFAHEENLKKMEIYSDPAKYNVTLK